MKKLYNIIGVMLAGFLVGCSSDSIEQTPTQKGVLTLTTSVQGFEGTVHTRTDIAGTNLAVGDRMKLKIICPFSDHTEFGETTNGHSADGLWLLKWGGENWTSLDATDKVDVEGNYSYSSGSNLFGHYEAQQTPYVYTASTWSENIIFMSGEKRYSQYSYVFHADQSAKEDYLNSDLLWAQTFMQTGSYNVHLSFQHVMACLKITIPDSFTSAAVVTLEGMPDIDQHEVVVGDYYAKQSKVNSAFGYMQKCGCEKDDNGKVLGVAVISDEQQKALVYKMDGTQIKNSGVYTAHYDADTHTYYLIVPPCKLSDNAIFWIRDGERRYSYKLTRKEFEQGKQYPVNIKLPSNNENN